MLRAERLENRDAFWLTSRKIANRVIHEVTVARVAWVSFETASKLNSKGSESLPNKFVEQNLFQYNFD